MIRSIMAFLVFIAISHSHVAISEESDAFNGNQTLYELSYAADFLSGYVARLTNLCTGGAAPFIVVKFPNPSLDVKQKLLGFKLGFIGKNPYTGTRLNVRSDDPRRPSTAADIAAQKMAAAATRAESWDYLCDAYLWDSFEDYANAQLELVKFALEILQQENRTSDRIQLLAEVKPKFDRITKLVNGDPNVNRRWTYDLNVPRARK